MSIRAAFAVAALSVVAGLIAASVVPSRAAAIEPPPAPVLSAQRRSVTAELGFWCRPVGGHFSCTAGTPAVGHEFPGLRARPRAEITLDTRIPAERVRIELSPESGSGDKRTIRPHRLDARRWRFRMPRAAMRAQVYVSYADGSSARALTFLRPRAGPSAASSETDRSNALIGKRLPVRVATLDVTKRPNDVRLGSLERGETFKVVKLSASGKYAFGIAYGDLNRMGWVLTRGLREGDVRCLRLAGTFWLVNAAIVALLLFPGVR